MQISDSKLVSAKLEATSPLGSDILVYAVFVFKPTCDHLRHAANPKIVWKSNKKLQKPEEDGSK